MSRRHRKPRREDVRALVRAELARAAPDVAQWNQGTGNSKLPVALRARMARDFGVAGPDAAQFGPGQPAQTTPLDNTGEPRSWQYRTQWNIPSLPGEGRPLDLQSLRQLADLYDILRKGIEIRKDELCAMRLDIIARDTDVRRARETVKAQQAKIEEVRAFFVSPDKEHTWQSWLRMVLEEYFVIDALTIWKRRTLGNKLHSLVVIDGTTIKPMLNVQGRRPEPPDTAYQQYLYGVARIDWSADELIYAPKNRRVHKAYGFSPVEQFLNHINQALRFGRYWTDFFTDGTIPEGVAEAPATWTVKQIDEFNQIWDAMLAGDSRALHKLKFVPAGFKFHQFKEYSFNIEFARWLVGVTAAALDLTAQELGFEPLHGGLGGRGYAEEQSKVLKRKSDEPIMRWLCDEILNPIIWREFGAPDLQATLFDPNDEEEALQEAQAIDTDIRNGRKSLDQIIEEDGGEPPGIGRILVVGNQVYGEPDLIALTKQGKAALMPAPLPGAPGSNPSQADSTPSRESTPQPAQEPSEPAPKVEKSVVDEVQTFLRFARERQKAGFWRDFTSAVLPTSLLADLNKAAKAGATSDELRSLVGLSKQPEAFRQRVGETERAYRALTSKVAKRVAEEVEARA